MASLLGLYMTPDGAARAVAALRGAGFAGSDLEVVTDTPYPEGTFGEEPVQHHLLVFPLVGAACGLIVGLLLTIGVQLAYPMIQGGKPLLSIPPMINVLYEATLLGAIVLTVIGVVFESRLPDFSGEPHDPRIGEGLVGVLVRRLSDRAIERAVRALREAGALDIVEQRRA
jgi:Protein of unknown function (DUF3341)